MIRSLSLEPYRLDWQEETGSAEHRFRAREGLLLTLEGESGQRGTGEAAPLPGRSRESLADCRAALAALTPATIHAAGRAAPELLPAELPAARHALETALLELEARERGIPAWQLFAAPESAALPVAGLVDTTDPTRATAMASALLAAGAAALKLKVGDEAPLAIARRVRAVAALGGARLRLDANRCLSPEQATELVRLLAGTPIEFVEEPTDPDSLPGPATFPLPLALDESLAEGRVDLERAQVLVLKPMALGGLSPCLALAGRAAERGCAVVVSHFFDGPHAMAAARTLALALGPGRMADGLGPHAVLRAWPRALPSHLLAMTITPWSAPGFGVEA